MARSEKYAMQVWFDLVRCLRPAHVDEENTPSVAYGIKAGFGAGDRFYSLDGGSHSIGIRWFAKRSVAGDGRRD